MKHLLITASCLCASVAVHAELKLEEIRTASKDVLVAYFRSTVVDANEVNTTNLAAWKLNSQAVAAINKFVTEADACEHDPTRFGTEVTDSRSASLASGMFMHLARLIEPYNAVRSQELQKHAEMAFAAAGDAIRTPHKVYYAVQKYLLTGDEAAHQIVKDLSTNAMSYAETFNAAPESFAGNSWLASYFFSYIVAKGRPTDPLVVNRFKAAIQAAANTEIGYLAANAYPVGTPPNLRWWGSNAAQGQYAYPCLIEWSLTGEQKYIDAACQLMDYVQGLNPIGKCYMTGLGSNRVRNPHDRESAYTKKQGWGPRPGILVFGPGGRGRGVSVPAVTELPRERRYIDNLGSIQWSEFTVYQSLCFPAAVYPVLAQGGKYDGRVDPFNLR